MTTLLQPDPSPTEPTAAAGGLPGPERRPRRRGWGRKVFVLLLVVAMGAVGVVLAGRPSLGRSLREVFGAPKAEATFIPVTKGRLRISVVDRGDVESSKNLDVFCEVEGQAVIIFLTPEGDRVKKGDLICEFDSSTLRDNLANQLITAKQAEADYQAAIKATEVAVIAVEEYTDGTHPQELRATQGELDLAAADLATATARLEWSDRMFLKGFVADTQNRADREAKLNRQIAHQSVQTKMRVAKTYTEKRDLLELAAQVDKAKNDEECKKAVFELEKSKQAKLETQIAKCKVFAPIDGLIVYANDTDRRLPPGMSPQQIMEGATVHERQRIFRLPDPAHMRLKTKLHESIAADVATGQTARIKMDAGESLRGTVASIEPISRPADFLNPENKVYSTYIAIENPPADLRPGMTGQVEILINEFDNVFMVPLDTVIQFQGKDHVMVATPNGPKLREVELGAHNSKAIEVKKGLAEGEHVALDPFTLMTESQRRAFAGWTADAP